MQPQLHLHTCTRIVAKHSLSPCWRRLPHPHRRQNQYHHYHHRSSSSSSRHDISCSDISGIGGGSIISKNSSSLFRFPHSSSNSVTHTPPRRFYTHRRHAYSDDINNSDRRSTKYSSSWWRKGKEEEESKSRSTHEAVADSAAAGKEPWGEALEEDEDEDVHSTLMNTHLLRMRSQGKSSMPSSSSSSSSPPRPTNETQSSASAPPMSMSGGIASLYSHPVISQTTRGFSVIKFSMDGKARPSDLARQELHSKFGLAGRDIRRLVSNLNYPTVLSRRNCILVDVHDIHAIITHNTLYLLQGGNLVDVVSYLQHDLQKHYSQSVLDTEADDDPSMLYSDEAQLPWEFKVLESILQKICLDIDREYVQFFDRVQHMTQDPSLGFDEERLYELLQLKASINRYITFVEELHEEIDSLLQSDEDMIAMYLTDKHKGGRRSVDQHEELELLLETVSMRLEDTIARLSDLRNDISSTQDFINICLDSLRNRMMEMELKLSIAMIGIGVATLIAGIFGMNLLSHMEQSNTAFYVASIFVFALAYTIFRAIVRHMRARGIFRPTYLLEKQLAVRMRNSADFRPESMTTKNKPLF